MTSANTFLTINIHAPARGRRANPLAYPTRRLFLNVRGHAPENEAGLRYDLRFLTTDGLAAAEGAPDTAFFYTVDLPVKKPGLYQFRVEGEHHVWNPDSISKLQRAVRDESYPTFRAFSEAIRMSECSANASPPPTATPLTAAITGIGNS